MLVAKKGRMEIQEKIGRVAGKLWLERYQEQKVPPGEGG
jgi:hypothetical protein